MVGRFVRGLLVLLAIVLFAGIGAIVYFRDPDVSDADITAKYGQPPSQFIVLKTGARVHYRDQGSRTGMPLVLLHGSNSSLHTWEPWVAQIGDQFRMISVDLPSHGLTGAVPGDDYSQEGMSQFVDEFTKALNLDRFALAGNSMGGGVAARYAIHHPERVSHLILVDAAGMPLTVKRDPGLAFVILRTPVLQNVLLYITPRALFEEELKKYIYDDSLVTADMVDRYWELARRAGNRAATLKRFLNTPDTFVKDNASKITTPTLILWGDSDTLIPREAGDAYNAAIPGSKMVVFRNAGHVPMEEVPEQSARAVREFLAPTP
jgi:pimeloyl-ACP methyl ester carboxylesterase